MQNNNPLTEISMLVLAVLLIGGGFFLLFMGKIDFTAAILLFGSALALFGVNSAFKAPSPAQQTQLVTQQENLQQLTSQVLNTIPAIVQAQTPAQPVPQQPVQMPIPAGHALPSDVWTNTVTAQGATQVQVPQQPFPAKQSTFEMPVVPVQQ